MDELIKRLRNCATGAAPCNTCDLAEDVCCTDTLMEQAADAIEELQADNTALNGTVSNLIQQIAELSKPLWSPVTEQPPLKVGDNGYNGYLVYANGYYEVADYTTDKFDNIPYFHVDGEYEPDVRYFMPLPEPPKEET